MLRAIVRPFVALYSFVRLIRSPEDNLGSVVSLLNSLIDEGVLARIRQGLPRHPQVAAALVARPRIAPVDLNDLLKLPSDTLGYAWAKFLTDHGFSLDDLPAMNNAEGDFWISTHMRETHDLMHVLTGFDTDIPGEMGVQGFQAAQLPGLPVPYLLAAGVMLNSAGFQSAEVAGARMAAFQRGYLMGKQAQLLFGLDWRSMFHLPLAEVRATLKLDPEAATAATTARAA